jgi:alcohol dehydrogenase (cytochrome c)
MKNLQPTFGVCALVLFGSLSAVGQQASFIPVTDRMLQSPLPEDWLMWRRTLNSWGYSPLNQITRANVAGLKMVWSRGMAPGVQEATPLAYRGILYLPNPSDLVQALNGATGDLIWEYKRKLSDDVNKFLLVPSINRNLAIYGNLIIDTSVDDFVYALDATTGKLAWETRIVDYREDSAQETSGPIIANGRIISGRGCEYKATPNGCVITAHDGRTGKQLWRTRTIPKLANLATRPGAVFRTPNGATSAPGWCPASTPI